MPFHLHLTPKKIQQIFRTHDSIHTQDQAGVVVRQKYAAIVVCRLRMEILPLYYYYTYMKMRGVSTYDIGL